MNDKKIMNKEIKKAIKKQQRKQKPSKIKELKSWYKNKYYKIWRVILFPIYLCLLAHHKIKEYRYNKEIWDEERVNKILNYYIPRTADWNEEDKSFYFFDNGYGWNLSHAKKHLKFKDRHFWKHYTVGWGGEIRRYLVENFELEGFTKENLGGISSWDDTKIVFKMIETKEGKNDNS